MRYAAILAVSVSLALAGPAGDLTTIKLNGVACGPEGTAKHAREKALNRLKNRYAIPLAGDIDPVVSLAALLAPGYDDGRFSARKAARIQGYVVSVTEGSKETCNCDATLPDEKDTHIALALAAGAPPTQQVIVEVTPRLRILRGKGWTTKALKKAVEGKWVEVTGWLLFDAIHVNEAENTNPGGARNWRATCWEVHPVTDIKVLPAAPAAAADFQPKSFAALQALHAARVARDPRARAVIRGRNAGHRMGFGEDARAAAEEEAKERRR